MTDKKITIVEDEPVIAFDTKRVLERFGYTVNAIYNDAESLLSGIKDNFPDLIIMDIQLGEGLTGTEAAALIRKQYDIPIIFATAYADDVTVQKAIKNQPFAYIVKPFTDETLFTTVNVVFSRVEVEKKLKEANKRFENMTNLLPLIVLEMDLDGKIIFINNFGKKYLKINTESIKLYQFIENKKSFTDYLNNIKKTGMPDKIQTKINIDKKNKNIPVLIIMDNISKDNEITGFRGVIIDFKDIEKIKEELIEINRFTTVSNLIAKFKEELSRYIKGSAEIIDDLMATAFANKVDLEFVKTNLNNALKITDNLVLLHTNDETNWQTANLNDLILDISRTMAYILRDKKIKFTCNCDHSIPRFYLEPVRIKKSLLLLFSLIMRFAENINTFLIETKNYDNSAKVNIILLHSEQNFVDVEEEILFKTAYKMISEVKGDLSCNLTKNKSIFSLNIPLQNKK